MNVKQITIFLEDKPGTLHGIISTLNDKNIHIRGFTAVDIGGMTILRLIVNNVMWTAAALKDAGIPSTFTEVLVAEVAGGESGLVKLLDILKDANINIQHVYPILNENPIQFGQNVFMVFEVNDNAKAVDVLRQNGVKVLMQEELAEL